MGHAYRQHRIMARSRYYDLTHHDSISLLSMGDLHATAAHADLDMIRGAVEWLQEKKNRYAVIPGDVFDTAIKGSISLDLSEQGMSAKDGRHLLARMLDPVRDRILAILSGNHDERLPKETGEDSVDALCCQLGIPYFPEGEAFLRLGIGEWAHNHRPCNFNIYMTHGHAGGRMVGGKANALIAMKNIVTGADVYLNGHGHDPILKPEVEWYFDKSGNIMERPQWFISCGASLKRGGYPVKKAYKPLARIWPIIELHGDGMKHMKAYAEN